jgi:hypothetical protein
MGLDKIVEEETSRHKHKQPRLKVKGKLNKKISYWALKQLKGNRFSKFMGKAALGWAFGDLSGKVQENIEDKVGLNRAELTKYNLIFGAGAIAQYAIIDSFEFTEKTIGKPFEWVYIYPAKYLLMGVNYLAQNEYVQSAIQYMHDNPQKSIEIMIAGITLVRLGYVLAKNKPIRSWSLDYLVKTGLYFTGKGFNWSYHKLTGKPPIDVIEVGKKGYNWLADKVNDAYDVAHEALFHNGLFNGNGKHNHEATKN